MNYQESLNYLDWRAIFGIKEGLERIKALAEKGGISKKSTRSA